MRIVRSLPAPRHGIDSRDYGAALMGVDPKGADLILEQSRPIAIRKGQWKYYQGWAHHKRTRPKKWQPTPVLVDVESDKMEENNLVEKKTQLAKEMRELWEKYQKQGLAE